MQAAGYDRLSLETGDSPAGACRRAANDRSRLG
jgi:hypothetical protein